jgi:hypothetical protein
VSASAASFSFNIKVGFISFFKPAVTRVFEFDSHLGIPVDTVLGLVLATISVSIFSDINFSPLFRRLETISSKDASRTGITEHR